MDVSSQLPTPAAALSGGKLPARQAHDAASTPETVLTEVLAIQPLFRETAETATTSVRTASLTGFEPATKRTRTQGVTATPDRSVSSPTTRGSTCSVCHLKHACRRMWTEFSYLCKQIGVMETWKWENFRASAATRVMIPLHSGGDCLIITPHGMWERVRQDPEVQTCNLSAVQQQTHCNFHLMSLGQRHAEEAPPVTFCSRHKRTAASSYSQLRRFIPIFGRIRTSRLG